ncbi:MAG: leucine-rich repeat domain-containing protein [Candidatus Kariarchaeaceae archaeon]|jgi:Leucine-rich repeat (LRR) protein
MIHDYSELNEHTNLFDMLLGPDQSKNREIRFDYDVGRDARPDSLKPGREFFRVQITTRNADHNPIRFSWFYHSDHERKFWYMSSISFRGMGLRMLDGDYLRSLTKLEYLDLQGNRLQTFDLSSIHAFETLHTINLSSNCLTTISLESCALFPNLRYLSLHSNNIDKINLKPLSNPALLNRLVLSDNKLTFIDISPLNDLRYLLTFDLSHNSLSSLSISLQNKLLKSLILNDNNLQQLSFANCRLEQLSLLSLANNRLKSFDMLLLHKHFPNLHRLLLWGNRLTDFSWSTQSEELELEEIYLSSNFLSTLHLTGTYKTLITLDIAYNYLNSVNLQDFVAPSLEILNLSFNPIKKIILPPLHQIPNLKTLDLSGTQLSEIVILTEQPIQISEKTQMIGKSSYQLVRIGNLTVQVPANISITKEVTS